jgi:hypothetical protein
VISRLIRGETYFANTSRRERWNQEALNRRDRSNRSPDRARLPIGGFAGTTWKLTPSREAAKRSPVDLSSANPQPDRKEEDLTTERTEDTEGVRGSRYGRATRREVKPCRGWTAFRFRVVPLLPWTILVDKGLGFAITFEEAQYLGTEGREAREKVENRQRLSPFSTSFDICILTQARYQHVKHDGFRIPMIRIIERNLE